MSVEASDPMVAIAPGMTRCEWCSFVYDRNGKPVNPRPSNWSAIPHQTCPCCLPVERMAKLQQERARSTVPMTRVEKFEAGVIEKGKPMGKRHKIISVKRTLEAVDAGRSCLPVGDRD